jgi:hypothetical protein
MMTRLSKAIVVSATWHAGATVAERPNHSHSRSKCFGESCHSFAATRSPIEATGTSTAPSTLPCQLRK